MDSEESQESQETLEDYFVAVQRTELASGHARLTFFVDFEDFPYGQHVVEEAAMRIIKNALPHITDALRAKGQTVVEWLGEPEFHLPRHEGDLPPEIVDGINFRAGVGVPSRVGMFVVNLRYAE